jgi:hypothetical protein
MGTLTFFFAKGTTGQKDFLLKGSVEMLILLGI